MMRPESALYPMACELLVCCISGGQPRKNASVSIMEGSGRVFGKFLLKGLFNGDPHLSREHFRIDFVNNRIFVTNLSANNDTVIKVSNGQLLTLRKGTNELAEVHLGAAIRAGNSVFRIEEILPNQLVPPLNDVLPPIALPSPVKPSPVPIKPSPAPIKPIPVSISPAPEPNGPASNGLAPTPPPVVVSKPIIEPSPVVHQTHVVPQPPILPSPDPDQSLQATKKETTSDSDSTNHPTSKPLGNSCPDSESKQPINDSISRSESSDPQKLSEELHSQGTQPLEPVTKPIEVDEPSPELPQEPYNEPSSDMLDPEDFQPGRY